MDTCTYLSASTYITERVEDQIKWYNNSASITQKKYKICQTTEIVLASLIPVLAGFIGKHAWFTLPVSLFGAAIAVIEGITKINKYHEKWIEYRATSEMLKYELFHRHLSIL